MNKVITTKDNRGNTMRIFDLGETVQISFNGGLVDLNKGELIKILHQAIECIGGIRRQLWQ